MTIAIGVRGSREFHTKNIGRLKLKMVTIPFRINVCALRLLTTELLAIESSISSMRTIVRESKLAIDILTRIL